MNKERRKALDLARATLERAADMIAEAKAEIETARDDEQSYYDNMPESLQGGDKGERASAAADALGEACDSIDEIESTLEAIYANLDTAGE